MKNKIIKMLGGYTKSEVDTQIKESRNLINKQSKTLYEIGYALRKISLLDQSNHKNIQIQCIEELSHNLQELNHKNILKYNDNNQMFSLFIDFKNKVADKSHNIATALYRIIRNYSEDDRTYVENIITDRTFPDNLNFENWNSENPLKMQ